MEAGPDFAQESGTTRFLAKCIGGRQAGASVPEVYLGPRVGGKQKEAHRAFVLSADLLAETAAEPWHGLSGDNLATSEAKTMVDWMLTKAGPFDMLILGDGCSCKARRIIEDALGSRAHVVETWLIYNSGTSKLAGRSVTLAPTNQEVIIVSLSLSHAPAQRCQSKSAQRTTHVARNVPTKHIIVIMCCFLPCSLFCFRCII